MAVRKSNTLLLLLVVMVLVVLVPTVRANIDTYDDYWKSRAKEAKLDALEAFDPSPGDVSHEFNQKVEKMIFGKNDTRRNLRGKKGRKRKNDGPCMATNPIDQCWRCRSNWAAHRKRLANCVIGFGRKTTGGKHGGYYFVTDPSDDDLVNPKPGTLRHAVIQPGPLWITFKNSMEIRLQEELIMTSNKTIDGRGVNVHIADGAGFTIQYIKNVIIHGIRIHDIVSKGGGTIRDSIDHFGTRTRSDGDGISIYGSSHIWIDNVAMWNCSDGLIDAIEGSTAITISNNHFSRHNDAMLFGASDTNTADAILQVTLAFNHFGKKLIQRMPRCRWGFFHIVNNDYTHWEMYAVGGRANPTIISQGNRYRASPYQDPEHDTRQVTKRDYASEAEWSTWTWRSDGDVMLNDAYFIESGTPLWKNDFSRYEMIEAKPGTFVSELTRFTGALTCRRRSPC